MQTFKTNEGYENYIDFAAIKDFEHFLIKVNEKVEYNFGLREKYVQPENDPALGPDVEYFGFSILQDDRMRYIIENIVSLPDDALNMPNKIGNTIISHFYGARGIHTVVTGIKDPKKAHVDFQRISDGDEDYLNEIKRQVAASKAKKMKFYGTTELHTSLQTAARNYCRVKYNDPARPASLTDIIEWISSWIHSGFIQNIITNATSLEKMFNLLRTQAGIGEYYGYHCATSNSVNPKLSFDHDENFCSPGPGAKDTLDKLFPTYTGKRPYGKMVIWMRDHQSILFPNLKIHEFFHNFKLEDGSLVFKDSQATLKVYGLEVACCQYGVYRHLKSNPHLINKRKVARLEDDSVCDGATIDTLF